VRGENKCLHESVLRHREETEICICTSIYRKNLKFNPRPLKSGTPYLRVGACNFQKCFPLTYPYFVLRLESPQNFGCGFGPEAGQDCAGSGSPATQAARDPPGWVGGMWSPRPRWGHTARHDDSPMEQTCKQRRHTSAATLFCGYRWLTSGGHSAEITVWLVARMLLIHTKDRKEGKRSSEVTRKETFEIVKIIQVNIVVLVVAWAVWN
jgi:hypothetical protein